MTISACFLAEKDACQKRKKVRKREKNKEKTHHSMSNNGHDLTNILRFVSLMVILDSFVIQCVNCFWFVPFWFVTVIYCCCCFYSYCYVLLLHHYF